MTGAAGLLAALEARGWSVGTAESLTGGLLAAALVDVPGASRVVRGGVVAYATALKASLLGVDEALLAARGAVDPDVAARMADGARRVLGADVAIATTGVAGPDPQDGHPPGLVHVAVRTPERAEVRTLRLDGGRAAVRAATVAAGIDLAARLVGAGDAAPEDPDGVVRG